MRCAVILLPLLCLHLGGCDRSVKAPENKKPVLGPSAPPSRAYKASKYDLNPKELAAIKRAIAPETDKFLRNLRPPDKDYPHIDNYGFQAAKFDLNGDGIQEVLFHYDGAGMCGSGGCTLRVYEKRGTDYRRLSGTTLTFLPIGVSELEHHGWRDLMITVRKDYVSSGIAPLRFDGTKYPLSWASEPAEEIGTIVLSEESQHYPLIER